MKKPIILLFLSFGTIWSSFGQSDWCVPVVDVANSSMSGIMIVNLNGLPELDRASPTTEGYVHASNTTTLTRGAVYALEVTKDAGIDCPDLNIRAYIDFNRDQIFDESTETVGLLNYAGDGPDIFNFTVPYNAVEGPTRMRICEKQLVECGMVPINACGMGDSLSYRGEVEDYTIMINGTVGIEVHAQTGAMYLTSNSGMIFLHVDPTVEMLEAVAVFDLSGREVWSAQSVRRMGRDQPIAIGPMHANGHFIVQAINGDRILSSRVWMDR